MRMPIAYCLLGIFALVLAGTSNGAPSKARQQPADTGAGVACRTMEVHTDAANHMTVVVFHQANDASRGALTALLRAHSGGAVEVEVDAAPSGTWRGTVFRLKSCFGRGLLLFSASAPPLKEGANFRLRLAAQ